MRRRRRRHGRRGHRGRGGAASRPTRPAASWPPASAELTLEAASAGASRATPGTAGSLLETAQASRDLAPEEVAPLLDEGIAVLQGVADGGDPAAMESFDFTPVHTYDLENCGWESSEVTAKDFAVRGTAGRHPRRCRSPTRAPSLTSW